VVSVNAFPFYWGTETFDEQRKTMVDQEFPECQCGLGQDIKVSRCRAPCMLLALLICFVR
jgi:hypothetical protein